ncbi:MULTISPECIES: argininosuccinate synthase [Sphaerochaeta]|jgi:argininosuccinate synthase|uniref:Argininosuccinate synthase n=2 Tax=root TaxID=1 RepID=A0ABY4DDY4_9SPIR|nr:MULTISPECIES: argininosuccinate synthase [Sphaerochaeta]MDT3359625.1 argininosuccinate synthase [Spirochaetota bacterium]MDD2395884.1 argininosuccinate synthase [Sphaerochaeta sp.]MDD3424285.1 argininosuccinate synthase [Sphaerochaeta sp.]MDD3456527.1 argininosuccinate synthase [Sphaerochaeta sp.]MDD4038028.1 argininosuccinate synthase [Sphaerochaeta sp.]
MNKEKIILAYSGGLDTSVILKWLANKGFDVIAYVANVGQNEDFAAIEKKALATGASKVYVEDLRKELVTDYIFPALKANTIYEGTYMLGTSLARPIIAKRQIEIARKEGTVYVAHGATGKGNDQVRFEFGYYMHMPQVKIISPWKDPEWLTQFEGRSDMIAYAQKYGIPIKASTKKPYSEDENLIHISHEAGILEDPSKRCEEDVFSLTLSPRMAADKETLLTFEFKNGLPVSVTNEEDKTVVTDPLQMILYLNKLGHDNAIGRVDMVENRYIGIKSRGVYETPGCEILWKAHHNLEGITMDKEVMHLRDSLMPKYAQLIYNGYWGAPEFEMLTAAFEQSQKNVSGTSKVVLYKGNVIFAGVSSPVSLYNEALGSMDKAGGYQPVDCKGFININAIRLMASAKRDTN